MEKAVLTLFTDNVVICAENLRESTTKICWNQSLLTRWTHTRLTCKTQLLIRNELAEFGIKHASLFILLFLKTKQIQI